jgi:hypothetical protein
MGCRRPRQRIQRFATGLLALSRPALRQCGEHELDAFRPTSASHCFDYEHSRLSCSQHLSEACASPSLEDLPLEREAGGPCVSRRQDPLRRVLRVRVWRFRPHTPEPTVPLTSLSLCLGFARCFRNERSARPSQDHLGKCPVKGSPPLWSEMPSIASSPASSAGSADLENGHVMVSASIQLWCPFAPDRPCFRTPDLTLGACPRTLSKSDEVENARFFAPNDQLTTSATTRTTREHDLERPNPRLSPPAVRAFPPCAVASAPASLARFVGVRGMR